MIQVITAEDACRQYRNKQRARIRQTPPLQSTQMRKITDLLSITNKALVARMPNLMPGCSSCGAKTWVVIRIKNEQICRSCVEVAGDLLQAERPLAERQAERKTL